MLESAQSTHGDGIDKQAVLASREGTVERSL